MTTNDNLRGLMMLVAETAYKAGSGRDRAVASDKLREIVNSVVDLAASDSGEVVMPERASRSNIDVTLGALGMYGRVDFGHAVKIYNQALDDVAALNKAPAQAEPKRRHWDDCPACTGVGHCDECTPAPAKAEPERAHDWVDARNSRIESGEYCAKCFAIRSGNKEASTDE